MVIGYGDNDITIVMPAQAGSQSASRHQRRTALDSPVKPENDGRGDGLLVFVVVVVIVVVFSGFRKTVDDGHANRCAGAPLTTTTITSSPLSFPMTDEE